MVLNWEVLLYMYVPTYGKPLICREWLVIEKRVDIVSGQNSYQVRGEDSWAHVERLASDRRESSLVVLKRKRERERRYRSSRFVVLLMGRQESSHVIAFIFSVNCGTRPSPDSGGKRKESSL